MILLVRRRYLALHQQDADYIYPPLDNPLLEYNDDDGILVEPKYYVPIILMVLINGMVWYRTGFSTNIPKFNPVDVVNNIKNRIKGHIHRRNHGIIISLRRY